MKQESIYKYYFLGTCLRYLQDITPGCPIHDNDGEWYLLTNLTRFLKDLELLELRITITAARKLPDFIEKLSKLPKETRLTVEDAINLSNIMDAVRGTLDAELLEHYAFVTSPKRHDFRALIEDPSTLFAPSVYAGLPDLARYDISEAGKCIAFERPTAAAFHLLRATENILREFYKSLVKQRRVPLMWGPMVKDLQKRRAAKNHEILLNHLDNLRESFRNPTQHPDMKYNIHEVQTFSGYVSMLSTE